MNLDDLHILCSDCELLEDILLSYTETDSFADMIDSLNATDTIWSMSEQNDMKEDDMEMWIREHLGYFVECRVFQEKGPTGWWPVVEIKCLDKVFYLDWCF